MDLYHELIRKIRKRLPKSPIFVHPVANVLPETRFLTLAFNRLLSGEASRKVLEKESAQFLDFQPMFTTGEPAINMSAGELSKLDLLPDLKLDGTHMSPRYLDSHLQPALARVWPSIAAIAG